MKKLKFDLLINKAQLFHIKTEKDILAFNSNNPRKEKLNYRFLNIVKIIIVYPNLQSNNGYLNFIMDYYL